jgi:hypothetical protein
VAAAQRKRWTAARKAKAEEATTPAPAKADKKERRLSPKRWAAVRRAQAKAAVKPAVRKRVTPAAAIPDPKRAA